MDEGRRSRWSEPILHVVSLLAILIPLGILVYFIVDVTIDGFSRLSWDFVTSYPSRHPERAGILPALVGSVYLILLTAAFALPLGVGAAVYLEEYAADGWLSNLIEVNINNLAGVPSVIYGLLGLGVFVRTLSLGRTLIAGALTMTLLILPIIILAAREAIRTVPDSLREASYALGATRWQTVRRVVLPMALPGILTGSILSISRAIGETAPLLFIGAATYLSFLPEGIDSPFTALPLQIFDWVTRPQEGFVIDAAAGIVVLLATLLVLNSAAVWLRQRTQVRHD